MVQRRTLLKVGGVLGVSATVAAGAQLLPIRPHLYDVRLASHRAETVSVEVQMDADDTTVLDTGIDVPPDTLLRLPCEWPRAAWTYEIAVRVADRDEWRRATWSGGRRLCMKIDINETGKSYGPVTFREAGSCPTTLDEHSCE